METIISGEFVLERTSIFYVENMISEFYNLGDINSSGGMPLIFKDGTSGSFSICGTKKSIKIKYTIYINISNELIFSFYEI